MVAQRRDQAVTGTRRRHARRRIAPGWPSRREREDSSAVVRIGVRAETDWLARAGAEREGDVTPRVEEGRRGRQMQDEAPYRPDDVDAELEQALTEVRHLRARTRGCAQPEAAMPA